MQNNRQSSGAVDNKQQDSLTTEDNLLLAQNEGLLKENTRLKKINKALMGQVERSMELNGNAFSLFRTAIVFEKTLSQRTTELRNLNSELSEAKNSMAYFLAAASHDILQPLNAARVYIAALNERELDGQSRQLAKSIQDSMDSTADLLSSLLDISRLDSNEMPVKKTDFALNSLLQSLCDEYKPSAALKGISLDFKPCNVWVHCDPKLIRRVLSNFLSNAIRYTPKGRILLGCRRHGKQIRVGVLDTGVGIPQNQLDIIFREFHRLSERQGNDSGVGLGLAIVDRIAKKLQLDIFVQSKLQSGSYFAITLPRIVNPMDNEPNQAGHMQAPQNTQNALVDCEVLVIDNEESILDAMETLLAGWGCRVRTSLTGHIDDINNIYINNIPDIILADYHLDDGVDGVSCVNEYLLDKGVPIANIVITADYEEEVRNRVQITNGHLLNKPVNPASLRALMSHCLRKKA